MTFVELDLPWQQKAINEIDCIFEWILKASKWDRLSNNLSDLLLTNVTAEQRTAINEAIKFIKAGDGFIKDSEIDELLNGLESKLGTSLAEKMREAVKTYQLNSYKKAQTELGLKFYFNQTDLKTLKWLEQDQMYWIGNHFDSYLRNKLLETIRQVQKEGLNRYDAGKLLRGKFKDQFNKSNSYWSGLADHIITKSREFGRTEGYVKAKITAFKIVNPSPVSLICKYMVGRIIKVKNAVAQRDAQLTADNPEDIKKLAPWISDKVAQKKVKGQKTNSIIKNLKIALPPYHFRCKSRTVVAYDNEEESFVTE